MFKVYKIAPGNWVVFSADLDPPRDTGSFPDEFDAENFRDFLNLVYAAGQKSVQDPIKAALGLTDVGN